MSILNCVLPALAQNQHIRNFHVLLMALKNRKLISHFRSPHTYFQWTEDGQGFQIQYLTLDTWLRSGAFSLILISISYLIIFSLFSGQVSRLKYWI